ncbi:MAG: hypothetical protein GXX78_07660 [Bacteroidales bacterium]|nr:hypothetical protein [Bacteroidales bacterium]
MKRGILFTFLVLLLLSFSLNIRGQNRMIFDQITTKDGLSNGIIYDIMRDSYGFMWFCTEDGLNRYDGYSFKVFRSESKDANITRNIQFNSITQDQFGRIWVATSDGLYFYDNNSETIKQFVRYNKLTENSFFLDQTAVKTFIDSRGYLWVGTFYGLIKIDIRKPDIKQITKSDIHLFYVEEPEPSRRISNDAIKSIVEDKDGKIWISNDSPYLDCYDHNTESFSHILVDMPRILQWKNITLYLQIDEKDNFVIYTRGLGIVYWDRRLNTFSEFQIPGEKNKSVKLFNAHNMLLDKNNRLWIGSDGNGLYVYDPAKGTCEHYEKSVHDQSNLSSNAIYSIYEDIDGTIWVGTYLSGVNKYANSKTQWGVHYSNPYSNTSLNSDKVTNFCEDNNGDIWISTDGGGVNKWDRKNHVFKSFTQKDGLTVNATMSLLCDEANRLWIGTYNGGLNILNINTGLVQKIFYEPEDPSSINSNSPWGFAKDKWGNMWIATVNSGLNLLKHGESSFVSYTNTENLSIGSNQISSYSLTYLFIDKKSRLWIGTESGLNMVDLTLVDFSKEKPKLNFNHFIASATENSISNDRISYISEDSKGIIWIGTKGAGLNALNTETMKFTTFTVSDGLPHNIINGILFDDDDNLWISTNYGISFFDRRKNQFHNFSSSDGLQSDLFYKTACFKTSDGMMLFGGINGFNAFYPSSIQIKQPNLVATITGFDLFSQRIEAGDSIDGKVLLKKPVYETDTIFLNYKQNNISFEFSTLNYLSPDRVIFSYKLDDFDKEWVTTTADYRIAKYTNLNPGEYVFKVRVKTPGYEWTDQFSAITVIISPPFWQTIWFMMFLVLFFSILFFLIYFIRIRTLQHQKKALEKAVDLKTSQLQGAINQLKEANSTKDKFMSIIAHDLINPLQTIMGLSELLLDERDKAESTNRNAIIKSINLSSNDLFNLLENLLHWSRSERGLLEYVPQNVDLSVELTKIVSLLAPTARNKEISLELKLPANEACMAKADVNFVNTIVRNLISNAIKFSHEKEVIVIDVQEDRNQFVISIIDQGVGMSEEKMAQLFDKGKHITTVGTKNEIGTGLGLLLVKELVEKQEGKLNVNSSVGEGSTFSFTLMAYNEVDNLE